jgi:hypothetical protein
MQDGVTSVVGNASVTYMVAVSARAHTRYRDTVNRREQNVFRVIGWPTVAFRIPSYWGISRYCVSQPFSDHVRRTPGYLQRVSLALTVRATITSICAGSRVAQVGGEQRSPAQR